MSTHPVLLGRVTGFFHAGDAPKHEGQTCQPCHVDIEASPSSASPKVTRVTHEDCEDRPSWTWRCFQMFIAFLTVIFTTWLAIALGSQESWDTPSYEEFLVHYDTGIGGVYSPFEKPALKYDPHFIALMVSTGIAGLAAMWLYLIAPTTHTLLAARFLCLNWVQGLLMLSSIAAAKGDVIRNGHSRGGMGGAICFLLILLRLFLLPCEILGLQFLVENRLQSLWPALNRPGCKLWLGRCLRMEVASLFLFVSSAWLNLTHTTEMFDPATGEESIWGIVVYLTLLLTICAVPILFLIWIVLVAMTLFRVVLMFHKALKVARQQGLAVVATFQVCCGRSILQCTGVVISLATSLMMLVAAFLFAPDYAVHGSHSALYGTIVPQCINLLINAAGIILLSGASGLITSKGTLRFRPLRFRCCRCHCRPFRRCRGLKSLCRSSLEICEENDWEKKTRELANRGISLEELLAFYKKLGDTVMESFQPSVHTTTDVVRLAIIPMTASSCSSYAQLVNKGEKVLPKKMVTHNWSNLFRDLVASVISETLGEQTFEFIAELLSDKAGVEVLEKMLQVHGSLETYWICAFAVNQH